MGSNNSPWHNTLLELQDRGRKGEDVCGELRALWDDWRCDWAKEMTPDRRFYDPHMANCYERCFGRDEPTDTAKPGRRLILSEPSMSLARLRTLLCFKARMPRRRLILK